MQPHQQRVVDEKTELDEKRAKLAAFSETEIFAAQRQYEKSLIGEPDVIQPAVAAQTDSMITNDSQDDGKAATDAELQEMTGCPACYDLIDVISDHYDVPMLRAVTWLNLQFNNCLRDEIGNRSIFDDVDE